MVTIRLKWIAVILAALFLGACFLRAQSGQIFYMAPASGTTTTNCGTPASGSYPLCGVATGWYVWNGSAWVQIGTAASGVSSVTVCNMAGTCGTAQTGAVSLKIPSAVSVTVGNPTATVTQGQVTATLQ